MTGRLSILPECSELNLTFQAMGTGVFIGDDGVVDAQALYDFLARLRDEQTVVVEGLLRRCSKAYEALAIAERFMAGFEDDPLQDGVNDKLAVVRAALPQWGRRR